MQFAQLWGPGYKNINVKKFRGWYKGHKKKQGDAASPAPALPASPVATPLAKSPIKKQVSSSSSVPSPKAAAGPGHQAKSNKEGKEASGGGALPHRSSTFCPIPGEEADRWARHLFTVS